MEKPNPNSLPPIGIIGNLNIDLIIRGVPHLPGWGQEVMGVSRLQVSAGQAGYLAFGLRRLGAPAVLIGNVGEDLYGRQILDELNAAGADTRGVSVMPGGATGISVAAVREDGERAFITELGCLRDLTAEVVRRGWPFLEPAEIVCLVGIFCTPGLTLDDAAGLLAQARSEGKRTMLDTGWDPENWPPATLEGMRKLLAHTSIFLPNWDEARAITGAESPAEAAERLQQMGPALVVIKYGARGSFARRGSQAIHMPSRRVEVFDAVGAGDIFNSGFLYGLLHGWPLEACLAFGNSGASLYISRRQERFPSLAEVTRAAQEYPAFRDLTGTD